MVRLKSRDSAENIYLIVGYAQQMEKCVTLHVKKKRSGKINMYIN